MRLKVAYPDFIRNSAKSLALMLPPACDRVTAACPAQDAVLPLWMEGAKLGAGALRHPSARL